MIRLGRWQVDETQRCALVKVGFHDIAGVVVRSDLAFVVADATSLDLVFLAPAVHQTLGRELVVVSYADSGDDGRVEMPVHPGDGAADIVAYVWRVTQHRKYREFTIVSVPIVAGALALLREGFT